jgi:hypothetical protein
MTDASGSYTPANARFAVATSLDSAHLLRHGVSENHPGTVRGHLWHFLPRSLPKGQSLL